jgi:predicted alpha-1,2-mannosidase
MKQVNLKSKIRNPKSCLVSCVLIFASVVCQAQTDYTKFIDPFIGTGGHGHTYPGATVPFGMIQLSPDTRIDGSWDGCSGYHYSDSVIYGFSHTHLSGTGCSDYGDIMLMPVMGESSLDRKTYSSKFSHADEVASPGYYSVKLRDNIFVELTSTARVGMHRYTFPSEGTVSVVLDLTHRDKLLEGKIHQVNATTFEGLRRSEAWAKNQWVFYRIEFSEPVVDVNIEKVYSDDEKASFKFNIGKGKKLLAKVSLSSVSEDGARKNMDSELPKWDFEKVKEEAHDAWQKELSKIEVSGGTEEQTKIFYTALYHCFLQPNIYNDVDGQYRGRDLKIHIAEGFNYYTVFSLWDTFRAWHPLMTIIDRNRTLDFIKTFLAQYEQGGLLPVWELSSNETECMIGYHSVSVIADAALKGITGFDMEKAFEAMKKSAMMGDRYGLGAYMEKGCLSADDESESVSKTLEYAYDDWCIAQMARLLNKEKEYQYFMERSQSWKNLFDPQSGFIRPRKNGGWLEPFDPYEVNNNYTEANAWQYTFFVPQDIETLIEMSGGKERFEKKLDELFTASTQTTGRDQSDISGMIGQYAHGNEPSHHMAYLYNYIDKPEKTQQRVHQVLTDFYHATPDGLIGNEDCGQMSAWYVMSAIGLYQVCPGKLSFEIFQPLFSKVILNLENGKAISLNWNETGFEKKFINSVFTDEKITGSLPIKDFKPGNAKAIISLPVISSPKQTFKKSNKIVFESGKGTQVLYTLDGSIPNFQSAVYKSPITIDSTTTIHAIAVNEKKEKMSKVVTANFYKMPHPEWKIKILSTYNRQYTAGGDEGLIDGIYGEVNWRKGGWQGYQSQDFECVIDLGSQKEISQCTMDVLQDTRSWILFPKQTEFSYSTDSVHFSSPQISMNTIAANDYNTQLQQFTSTITKQKVRYVKIKAVNYGKLPEWHAGAGGDAFIFVDEITVE